MLFHNWPTHLTFACAQTVCLKETITRTLLKYQTPLIVKGTWPRTMHTLSALWDSASRRVHCINTVPDIKFFLYKHLSSRLEGLKLLQFFFLPIKQSQLNSTNPLLRFTHLIMSIIHFVSVRSHRYDNEMAIRQSVEGDIAGLKRVIDDTNMTRMNIESEIEAVKEELAFLKKSHENVSHPL